MQILDNLFLKFQIQNAVIISSPVPQDTFQ